MDVLYRKLKYFDQRFTLVVPNGSINNKSTLVQVVAWHQTGKKQLSETIMMT